MSEPIAYYYLDVQRIVQIPTQDSIQSLFQVLCNALPRMEDLDLVANLLTILDLCKDNQKNLSKVINVTQVSG